MSEVTTLREFGAAVSGRVAQRLTRQRLLQLLATYAIVAVAAAALVLGSAAWMAGHRAAVVVVAAALAAAGAVGLLVIRRGGESSRLAPAARGPVARRNGFAVDELVVYPAHGVGRIIAIEQQEVAGLDLELFVIEFAREKLKLRVPTAKTTSVGLRKLSEPPVLQKALENLEGLPRTIRANHWREECDAKIFSGDIGAIAEVVRDLYRSGDDRAPSSAERALYQVALQRLAAEIAAVRGVDESEAVRDIEQIMAAVSNRHVGSGDREPGERVEFSERDQGGAAGAEDAGRRRRVP